MEKNGRRSRIFDMRQRRARNDRMRSAGSDRHSQLFFYDLRFLETVTVNIPENIVDMTTSVGPESR